MEYKVDVLHIQRVFCSLVLLHIITHNSTINVFHMDYFIMITYYMSGMQSKAYLIYSFLLVIYRDNKNVFKWESKIDITVIIVSWDMVRIRL